MINLFFLIQQKTEDIKDNDHKKSPILGKRKRPIKQKKTQQDTENEENIYKKKKHSKTHQEVLPDRDEPKKKDEKINDLKRKSTSTLRNEFTNKKKKYK